jgi:ABC-type branched-subunit amino acid transport system substrate-binding protein
MRARTPSTDLCTRSHFRLTRHPPDLIFWPKKIGGMSMMKRAAILFGAMVLVWPLLAVAGTFLSDSVKIGVMNDQNGLYADLQGPGSVAAVRMAVEDFGGKIGNRPIEVIAGDHQNKPDIGTELARRWYDVEHVGAIVDLPQSAVALSVGEVARTKNRVALLSASNLDKLTGEACNPNQVQWSFNNYGWRRAPRTRSPDRTPILDS